MLLGNFNPYTEKLEIPKSYQVFSNFKKRVLNPAYKELKEKGDYYFEYELIKTGQKVISLNFQILKMGKGKNLEQIFLKENFLFIQFDLVYWIGELRKIFFLLLVLISGSLLTLFPIPVGFSRAYFSIFIGGSLMARSFTFGLQNGGCPVKANSS